MKKPPPRMVHVNRVAPARVFRVRPDESRPFVVEVRIARSRKAMHDEMRRLDGGADDPRCCGLVRSWTSKITKVPAIRPRQVVARMYLNVSDLRDRPSEIVSHEATHAGMAWARLQRANLGVMPGEEVLCYAVGLMVKQINTVCYAHGVWP